MTSTTPKLTSRSWAWIFIKIIQEDRENDVFEWECTLCANTPKAFKRRHLYSEKSYATDHIIRSHGNLKPENWGEVQPGVIPTNIIEEMLVVELTLQGQSFRLVDRRILALLLNYWQPGLRSGKLLKQTVLPSVWEKIKLFVRIRLAPNIRQKLQGKNTTASLDGWTQNGTSNHYFGINVMVELSDDCHVRLPISIVQTDQQDASAYKDIFASTMREFGLELSNITSITSDNASVNDALSTALKIPRIPCVAHLSHLVVTWALNNSQSFKNIMEKYKEINYLLKKKLELKLKLREKQIESQLEPLKPLLEVDTRWSSFYHSGERFLDLEAITEFSKWPEFDQLPNPIRWEDADGNNFAMVITVLEELKRFNDKLIGTAKQKKCNIGSVIPLIYNVYIAMNDHMVRLWKMQFQQPKLFEPFWEVGLNLLNEMWDRFHEFDYSSEVGYALSLEHTLRSNLFDKRHDFFIDPSSNIAVTRRPPDDWSQDLWTTWSTAEPIKIRPKTRNIILYISNQDRARTLRGFQEAFSNTWKRLNSVDHLVGQMLIFWPELKIDDNQTPQTNEAVNIVPINRPYRNKDPWQIKLKEAEHQEQNRLLRQPDREVTLEEEFREYLTKKDSINFRDADTTRSWAKLSRHTFPRVAKYIDAVFLIPPTAVDIERTWSQARKQTNYTNTRLMSEHFAIKTLITSIFQIVGEDLFLEIMGWDIYRPNLYPSALNSSIRSSQSQISNTSPILTTPSFSNAPNSPSANDLRTPERRPQRPPIQRNQIDLENLDILMIQQHNQSANPRSRTTARQNSQQRSTQEFSNEQLTLSDQSGTINQDLNRRSVTNAPRELLKSQFLGAIEFMNEENWLGLVQTHLDQIFTSQSMSDSNKKRIKTRVIQLEKHILKEKITQIINELDKCASYEYSETWVGIFEAHSSVVDIEMTENTTSVINVSNSSLTDPPVSTLSTTQTQSQLLDVDSNTASFEDSSQLRTAIAESLQSLELSKQSQDLEDQELSDLLKKRSLVMISTERNGNCFYESILQTLSSLDTIKSLDKFRNMAVADMRSGMADYYNANPELIPKKDLAGTTQKQISDNIREMGCYADISHIKVCNHYLQAHIVIHQVGKSRKETFKFKGQNENIPTLNLGFHEKGTHYVAGVPHNRPSTRRNAV